MPYELIVKYVTDIVKKATVYSGRLARKPRKRGLSGCGFLFGKSEKPAIFISDIDNARRKNRFCGRILRSKSIKTALPGAPPKKIHGKFQKCKRILLKKSEKPGNARNAGVSAPAAILMKIEFRMRMMLLGIFDGVFLTTTIGCAVYTFDIFIYTVLMVVFSTESPVREDILMLIFEILFCGENR